MQYGDFFQNIGPWTIVVDAGHVDVGSPSHSTVRRDGGGENDGGDECREGDEGCEGRRESF